MCGTSSALQEERERWLGAGQQEGMRAGAAIERFDVDETVVDEATDRKLREMVFLADIEAIEKAERNREFQADGDWLGEICMTEEEKEEVRRTRVRLRAETDAVVREEDRRLRHSVVQGPYHVSLRGNRWIFVSLLIFPPVSIRIIRSWRW